MKVIVKWQASLLKLHNKSNTEQSSTPTGLTKAAVWVCNRNKQGVWIAVPLYECFCWCVCEVLDQSKHPFLPGRKNRNGTRHWVR